MNCLGSEKMGVREAIGLRLFIFLDMFFMFKICVNGERDKYQFLILFFFLHFCSIFFFFFVLGGERHKI